MLSLFTAKIRVPYVSKKEDIRVILEESGVMKPGESDAIVSHVSRGKIFVGVKRLLGLLDSLQVKKELDSRTRVADFTLLLEDQGIYTPEL